MVDSTRRDLLKLIGAAGAVTGAGAVGIAAGQEGGDGDGAGLQGGMMEEITEGGIQTARVRFGHLIPDGPPVDIYGFIPAFRGLGEAPIQKGLEYGSIRPNIPAEYADIPAITLGVRITPAGDSDTTLIEIEDLELEAGRNYTLLAAGETYREPSDTEEPLVQALTLVDNADEENPGYGRTTLPGPEETQVRFVHALPDATSVDIETAGDSSIGGGSSGGETIVEGADFGATTGYVSVDEDDTFIISEDDEEVASVGGGLKEGRKYTIYIVSQTPEAGGLKPFAIATVDAVSRVSLNVRGL